MMAIMVASITGTVVIGILSVMTLTEGYGFEHKIDPYEDREINESHEGIQGGQDDSVDGED